MIQNIKEKYSSSCHQSPLTFGFNILSQIVDRLCSGRRTCSFRVPNIDLYMENFAGRKPCLDELKPYLEAAYICVEGMDHT